VVIRRPNKATPAINRPCPTRDHTDAELTVQQISEDFTHGSIFPSERC